MIYQVTAELDGRFWLVRVPSIERTTQARNVGEIETMAKDLIEIMTDTIDPVVHVTLVLPEKIEEHLKNVAASRALEEQARQSAAAELRVVARELREQRLSLGDVGAVLGVSHQRAHQLINS